MVTAPLNTRSIACSTSAGLAAGSSGALLGAAASAVDMVAGGSGFSSSRGGGVLEQLDERRYAITIKNRQTNPDGLLKMVKRVGECSEVRSFFICHISYAICRIKYGIWHMATPLERIQKRDEIRLLEGIQLVKAVSRERAADTSVALDRIVEAERQSVMHQLGPRTDAPERSSSHHVPGASAAVLDDAVARPDVVQQEVAERSDYLVADGRRDGERAPVNHGARRDGGKLGRVTDRASYLHEQSRAGIEGGDRSAQRVVLRQSIAAVEGIGDPHLVEVGVAGEGLQAGVLVLPPEATGSRQSASLDNRNIDARPYEARRLGKPDGLNGVAVDGLYEAVADGVEAGAESPGVLRADAGDVQGLHDAGPEGPKLNQRPVLVARRFGKDAVDSIPGPEFRGLAAAADHRVIVAYAATPIVVGRPKSIIWGFDLLEDEFVVLERAVRNRGRYAFIYASALGAKPVVQIVDVLVQLGRGSICHSLGSCDGIRQCRQTN